MRSAGRRLPTTGSSARSPAKARPPTCCSTSVHRSSPISSPPTRRRPPPWPTRLTTYDESEELAFLDDARAQWESAYASIRVLAADAAAADTFAADTSPRGDIAHGELAQRTDAITATAQELDQFSRGALEDYLADAHATKTKLLILLGAIFALSVGATIMYARRMARNVVRPIQTLWESADRFGAGEFDHRVEIHSDDEIGELAERFNVMADTIASTHLHLVVQAHHDVLTGLVNRAGFMGRLDAAVDPAGTEAGSVSLMFIDLDDFKHVNDDLGHAAGDELLRQVADRLRGAARANDVVCRLGGDEFAILIASPTGDDVAVDMANRILTALEQPFSIHGALIRIGASIGIASQRNATLQRRLPAARRRHRDVRVQGSGQASLADVQPARPRPDRGDRARRSASPACRPAISTPLPRT